MARLSIVSPFMAFVRRDSDASVPVQLHDRNKRDDPEGGGPGASLFEPHLAGSMDGNALSRSEPCIPIRRHVRGRIKRPYQSIDSLGSQPPVRAEGELSPVIDTGMRERGA